MDWELRNLSLQCAQCGCSFKEGETICSSVVERGDAFERLDFCVMCHHDLRAEVIYARWRMVVPPKEAPPLRKAVNEQAVREFFDRLASEQDRMKRNFRYVLALMLMRKKILRFVAVRRGEGGEELILRDPQNDREHVVYNPQLAEDEILALTAEVGKVLNLRIEPPAPEATAESVPPEAAAQPAPQAAPQQ